MSTTIVIQPTETEFVDIKHRGWEMNWAIQFPEAIECADGVIRAWPTIHPQWERVGPGTWGYTWQPSAKYIQQVKDSKLIKPDGTPQYTRYTTGAELRAEIATDGQAVQLSLTLTNTSDQTLRDVYSDGGCFQARSESFCDCDEVARSYIVSGGTMTSMARLHRTIPIRCMYTLPPLQSVPDFEWFWGQTTAAVDAPAVVGAVSRDGRHAVVLGYENAGKAMQNADDHHCLHSGPWFGELRPGQSTTRRGWILFGDDIHALSSELTKRLTDKRPSSSARQGRPPVSL